MDVQTSAERADIRDQEQPGTAVAVVDDPWADDDKIVDGVVVDGKIPAQSEWLDELDSLMAAWLSASEQIINLLGTITDDMAADAGYASVQDLLSTRYAGQVLESEWSALRELGFSQSATAALTGSTTGAIKKREARKRTPRAVPTEVDHTGDVRPPEDHERELTGKARERADKIRAELANIARLDSENQSLLRSLTYAEIQESIAHELAHGCTADKATAACHVGVLAVLEAERDRRDSEVDNYKRPFGTLFDQAVADALSAADDDDSEVIDAELVDGAETPVIGSSPTIRAVDYLRTIATATQLLHDLNREYPHVLVGSEDAEKDLEESRLRISQILRRMRNASVRGGERA
jgi:hypothetical protein